MSPVQLAFDFDALRTEPGASTNGGHRTHCANCHRRLIESDLRHGRSTCGHCRERRRLEIQAERDWRHAARAPHCTCPQPLVDTDEDGPRCVRCGHVAQQAHNGTNGRVASASAASQKEAAGVGGPR